MNREAIDRGLERTILALVLGLLAFGTLAFGGVRPFDFLVLWWLVLAVLAVWGARIWLAPKFRFLWPPVCWAIIPFIGYAVWRYRTADIEFVARQELMQILLCALVFLAVVNNLYSQESTRLLSFVLIGLAVFVSMYGIYQWIRGSSQVWGLPRPAAYFSRASGSFICPNHLAGFLEMLLPLAVALTLTGRVKIVTRVFLAYASLVCFVGIAASQSRAGWLATGTAMLTLALFLSRTRGQRWIALLLVVIMAGSGYWLYSRSVGRRVAQTYLSGHERDIRLRLWVAAGQMWKDHPWWGVGPDHFDHRFRQYREAVDKTQARPGRVHNDYLNTLVDYGSIGFALLLLPLGVAIGSLIRCWPYVQRGGGEFGEKKSNRSAIVLGSATGLLALAVHSFFDFNLHIPSNAFLAVTLLAVLAAHIRFATERHWFTTRWPLALAATLVLGGCLYYLVPQAGRQTRELARLRKAETFPDGSAEKIALLESAFALEPKNSETAFALGEQHRTLAFTGGTGYEEQAKEALVWLQRASALNRWDPVSLIRSGMCLDWIDQHAAAAPFFRRALELDPNYWYPRAMMGWHEFQVENFSAARDWMLKSLEVNFANNPLAYTYLGLSEKMIREQNARPASPK